MKKEAISDIDRDVVRRKENKQASRINSQRKI
jgi:hypothetical protein